MPPLFSSQALQLQLFDGQEFFHERMFDPIFPVFEWAAVKLNYCEEWTTNEMFNFMAYLYSWTWTEINFQARYENYPQTWSVLTISHYCKLFTVNCSKAFQVSILVGQRTIFPATTLLDTFGRNNGNLRIWVTWVGGHLAGLLCHGFHIKSWLVEEVGLRPVCENLPRN